MIKDTLSSQEQAVFDLLKISIIKYNTKILLPLIDTSALIQPKKEVYLAAIQELAVNPEYKEEYQTFPYKGSFHKFNAKDNFHEEVIRRLGISVKDLKDTHETTCGFLLRVSGEGPLLAALDNSTSKEVADWLKAPVPGSTSDQRGDNRCHTVGMLMYSAAYDVLKAVAEKVPKWGAVLDHRSRNALFYANDAVQMKMAYEAGADVNQVDRQGRSLTTWWTTAKGTTDSTNLINALSEIGAAGAPTAEDSMVNKLLRLGVSHFENPERAIFDQAFSDPKWRWTGILEGVQREWSLQEIWRFGELAVMSNHTTALDYNVNSNFNYIKYPRTRGVDISKFLETVRSTLPEDVSSAWFNHPPSPLSEPFIVALSWLTSSIKEGQVPAKFKNINIQNTYLSENVCKSWYDEENKIFFSSMTSEEQSKLIEGLEVVRDCRWAWDPMLFSSLMPQISGRALPKDTYIDRKLWAEYYIQAPLKSALHLPKNHTEMCVSLKNHVVSSDPDELVLSTLVQLKALGAFEFDPRQGNKTSLLKELQGMILGGTLDGVEVSPRWMKYLDDETRSLVSRTLLMNKAKSKRKIVEDPTPDLDSRIPKM